MDTLPLPPRPNLDQYRKRAKDLAAVARGGDPNAVRAWAREWLETLARLRRTDLTSFVALSLDRAAEEMARRVAVKSSQFALADAQFLISRAHGFENWPAFSRQLESLSRSGEFEAAVDAVVGGDLSTLQSLVRAKPSLVSERSARVHRATLLHYIAANGVEDYRQLTPPNAVAIARFLLESGADVDAIAETYGGGNAQTTMNLLVSSVHPSRAGLHVPLIESLLEFGAAINGLEDDESPLMTALAFGYPEAAEALARNGARVDNVIAAAALGHVELVGHMVVDCERLSRGVPLVSYRWMQLPDEAKAHIERALVWACQFGRLAVVQTLLARGVNPAARDHDLMSGLHHAAARGHLDVVRLLVAHGAPLEARNAWGGTVLDSTVYFARHQPLPGVDYPAAIKALIAAGADVGAVALLTGDSTIEAALQRSIL